MRAFTNSDDERFLQLAKKSNVFGGGRFDFGTDTCALNIDEFLTELTAAQEGKATKKKDKRSSRTKEESAAEEKPKRNRKKREEESVKENVATKTMYFIHEGTDEPIIVKKGELLDFLDSDIFDEVSKAEYEKLKAEFDEAAEPSADEKPKLKSRKRRERTPVDDVPPGEEESDEPPVEEEAPRRRRRTRSA